MIMESNKKTLEIVDMVREFHELFEHPIQGQPRVPEHRVELRVSLIVEEAKEFHIASLQKDIVEAADGLGDLLYVTAGAILEYGLEDKMLEIFTAIHKSNMTKACNSLQEAEATQVWYEKNRGITDSHIFKKSNLEKWLVYRADGKLLKSIGYVPVDIKAILDED